MKLSTPVALQPLDKKIDYHSRLLWFGSCFADNMGSQFEYLGFTQTTNPFGILFQPLALRQLVDRALQEKVYTHADLIFHNQLWHCFELHSDCSNPNPEAMLADLNAKQQLLKTQLQQATHIGITLGTVWVYLHLERDEIVANCHKIPQTAFSKELLSLAQIETALQKLIESIQAVNPNVQLVFTVRRCATAKTAWSKTNAVKRSCLWPCIRCSKRTRPITSRPMNSCSTNCAITAFMPMISCIPAPWPSATFGKNGSA